MERATNSSQIHSAKFAPIIKPVGSGVLQRACACGQHTGGGECASCQPKGATLQRASVSSVPANDSVPSSVHDVLSGSGQPLDTTTRSYFEPRFGHDFSHVRVHTDSQAAESARAVNALAYTVGRNVVFGAGQYQPGTMHGNRLLAHELTHTIQQGSSVSKMQGKLKLGAPGDAAEQEADKVAAQVSLGEKVSGGFESTNTVGRLIQRDLATPSPEETPAAQTDLTPEQIQAAIAFNHSRYDATNIRLIQDLLGGPITGRLTAENIEAIASVQEEYGLKKDGMVGPDTFRFLNNEQRLEGMSTRTADCLTAFRVIEPDAPLGGFVAGPPAIVRFRGHFRTEAQFSSRCNCSQFQYRQFIQGTATLTRGTTVQDVGTFFSKIPGGRLPAAFQEDGNTDWASVNFGHRDQAGQATTDTVNSENHYVNATGGHDQTNGCSYRGEDFPQTQIQGVQTGDVIDLNVNFRGEIQRNNTPITQRRWTGLNVHFVIP